MVFMMIKMSKGFIYFLLIIVLFAGFSQNSYAQETGGEELTGLSVDNSAVQMSAIDGFLGMLFDNSSERAIFVNFYASWCGPCREEIPHLIELREEYPESELLIIGVNLDATEEEMKDFDEKMKINYPTFHDADRILASMYSVRAIPFSVLYDGLGKVVFAQSGIVTFDMLSRMIDRVNKTVMLKPENADFR